MVKLLSPRIEELYNKLSCGTLVLGEFWKEVEREGTPLIEEVQGEEKVIITFLYRGNEGVNNVLIYGGVPGYRYSENIMERLEDTDIWFKSYIVRNDVKFKYNFSLNYEFHNDYKKIKKNSIIDSLNPKRVVNVKDEENPESVESVYSLVELPKVKPGAWTIPNKQVKKGNIKLSRFESKILGNTRRMWVYTPSEYDEKTSLYNVLVLTDGFDYLSYLSANVVLDNLIHEKRIPPTVCILVDSTKNRYEELTCNESFMKFITEEVMPWSYGNYNITKEPERTIIGGLSLGGLTASFIALKRWDIFGKVLSQSGSYWYESQWLTKEFEKEQKLPIRFYLNAGLLEDAPYDDEPVMMEVINNMRDVLLSKGYDVKYENFQSGHDYLCWGETLATGLISLNTD
ncbi:alpha/beta hydrolase-fold protein [Clostridium sp. UBA4548]|uniref:alpha/beta hydrolase-fold protein n=1 Tax=Clostridium sp. UBA4548 TaxID=1946361 RepID=UPI0025C44CE8|nr:alpha/beta hydrolase-fold protein [Clostridium sp. UBA4548]